MERKPGRFDRLSRGEQSRMGIFLHQYRDGPDVIVMRMGYKTEVKWFLSEARQIGKCVKPLLPRMHPAIEENAGIADIKVERLGADLAGATERDETNHFSR